MAEKQKQPFYKKKWFIVIAALIVIGAIFDQKDKDKKDTPEPAKVEEKQEEVKEEEKIKNHYEEIAKFAFGEDVKCDVIEIKDENNNPKVTRINITYSGEPNVQPLLSNAFTYLKKIKDQGLDYESVFFILRAKKTDGEEYPYAKIEISKESADNFDFDTKTPSDLKSIAETYDVPDNNEDKSEISTEEDINNEDTKTFVTALAKTQFEEFCDVSTETKDGLFIIHLHPTSDDLKTEIAGLMLDTTNPQLLDGWETMKEGLIGFSTSVNNEIDENVSIMLHNPVNDEMVLLTILNDTVIADFTQE